MQSIHISKDSCHYRFLRAAGQRPWDNLDLCSYVRSLVLTIFMLIVFVSIVFGGAFSVFLIACFYVAIPNSWVITLGLFGVSIIVYIQYLAKLFSKESEYIRRWKRRHHPNGSLKTNMEIQREWSYRDPYKRPSFYAAVWTSFKDKVCFRLEIN